jgi:hypothetical protein
MNPYNLFYNLEQIECPNWLPGTEEVVPEGVSLSPQGQLRNKMRCYCQIVKVKERECLQGRAPAEICKRRTLDWIKNNLEPSVKVVQSNVLMILPKRNLIINEN